MGLIIDHGCVKKPPQNPERWRWVEPRPRPFPRSPARLPTWTLTCILHPTLL